MTADGNRAGPDGAFVPSPRPAPDDNIENLPTIDSDQPVWLYEKEFKRNADRRFIGHVTQVSGTEGDRLRDDLTAVIRDLLDWAAIQSQSQSPEDGAADGKTE